jgi:hypothetical protein
MVLEVQQFVTYFRELWSCDPFPWQHLLAVLVCNCEWPATIDLPTASGKTACLDIHAIRAGICMPETLLPPHRLPARDALGFACSICPGLAR